MGVLSQSLKPKKDNGIYFAKRLPQPPKPEECMNDIYDDECLKNQREHNKMCSACPFWIKK